jgi:hypothetical protein
MMKKIFFIIFIIQLSLQGTSIAALWDRGGGLIYDDLLKVTWLQHTDLSGKKTWPNLMTWVNNLVYHNPDRNIYYDDWRLPRTLPVNGSSYVTNLSYDGSTDIGYNISAPGSIHPGTTASEMAHLFYFTLGNPYGALINTGPFINLQEYTYWSESLATPSAAWTFKMDDGRQDIYDNRINSVWLFYGWAVRDGDVVPIPSTILLLGLGLLGFAGVRQKSNE